jgi:hypothetical protein
LLTLLVEHDPADAGLPVAIETSQGLLVAGLRAAGRTVYSIDPMAVSRYRDRYRAVKAAETRAGYTVCIWGAGVGGLIHAAAGRRGGAGGLLNRSGL